MISFSTRADGAVVADFSASGTLNQLDDLSKVDFPGLAVDDVLTFIHDKEQSKLSESALPYEVSPKVWALANGYAVYTVTSTTLNANYYTVKRGTT
jgi:hypothetical protein